MSEIGMRIKRKNDAKEFDSAPDISTFKFRYTNDIEICIIGHFKLAFGFV